MMSTITIELPDEVFASMRCDPGQMAQEIRFATAMVWYEQGKISQEVAANLAGLDRVVLGIPEGEVFRRKSP